MDPPVYDEKKGTCIHQDELDPINKRLRCIYTEKCHYKSLFDSFCLLKDQHGPDAKGNGFKKGGRVV